MGQTNQPQTSSKSGKKSFLTLALSASAFFFFPQAHAGMPVSVVNCIPTSGAMGGPNCASEGTSAAQFQYLSTGRNMTLSGGIGSAAGVNDGVIELLRKLNDENAKGVEGQRQDMPNTDQANRQRDYSLKQLEVVNRYHKPVSAAACREATVSSGSLGGGGGGGGATRAAEAAGNKHQENEILTPKTVDTVLAETVAGDQQMSCTQGDVANKVPGCTRLGLHSGSNTRFSSLLGPAAVPAAQASRTIPNQPTDMSYRLAETYITLNRPREAPSIPEASKGKASAKKYLAMQRRYHASVLAVTNFYNYSKALTVALPANSQYVQNVWKNAEISQDYSRLYPGRQKPDAPSQRELMHFLVDRQFGPKVNADDMAEGQTPEYMMRRSLEVQKLNAYLLLKLHEQLEYNGMLAAQQLRQQVDPVTYKEMEQLSRASAD